MKKINDIACRTTKRLQTGPCPNRGLCNNPPGLGSQRGVRLRSEKIYTLVGACVLALCACAPLDRREGDVVVTDPSLQYAAGAAIEFWSAVTCGDTSEILTTQCDAPICTFIQWGELLAPEGGTTARSGDRATITIEPGASGALLIQVVAHELGHAIGLSHTPLDAPTEIMYYRAGNGPHCAGPATRAEYERRYGAVDCWQELCLP